MLVRGYAMTVPGQPLEPREYTLEPGPGEALVAVAGCGVCHTDLGFLHEGVPTRHALPLVLGHEVSGWVAQVGPGVSPELAGRSVIVPAVIPCGACDPCRRGRGQICRAQVFPGNDVQGGFATHLVVPARGLCPVDLPRGEGLAQLSVVADAVSTAWQAVLRSGLTRGGCAAFVGVGGVGGFGVQIAAALGARVIAIDVDPERLAALAGHGAELTVDARGKDARAIKEQARRSTKEAGFPGAEWRIFECSGTRAGQETAWALLNHGAWLGVVGYHPGEVSVRLSNLMAFDARCEGNWGCLPEHYPAVLELVLSGRVQVAPFVETHPLERINEVLERLRRHELRRRPVLLPDPDFSGER